MCMLLIVVCFLERDIPLAVSFLWELWKDKINSLSVSFKGKGRPLHLVSKVHTSLRQTVLIRMFGGFPQFNLQ